MGPVVMLGHSREPTEKSAINTQLCAIMHHKTIAVQFSEHPARGLKEVVFWESPEYDELNEGRDSCKRYIANL